MRICVVEDESAVRAGIIHKLNGLQKNITVFDVQFGFTALEKIKLIRPDLVITDIMMPELDGLEMLRLIKQEQPNTKVVLLSGYNEFEYARKGLQLGAANYLLKPLDRNELLDLINELETALTRRLQADLQPYLAQLARSCIELDNLKYGLSGLWFNETVPKRLLLGNGEEISSLPEVQATKVIISFSYKQRISGAVVECGVGEAHHFFTAEQFVTAVIQTLEQWETGHFMGSTAVPKQMHAEESDTLLRKSSRMRKLMLKAIRDMKVQELEQQLPLYFQFIGMFPLKLLRKECAALMASLDEGLTMKDDIAIVEDDKLFYWASWVAKYDSWTGLQKEMERFVIGGIKALMQLEQSQPYGIVERAVQLVARHADRHISLESVAEQLEIHPVTLSRIFKQHKGENFVHYVTREKMKQAERLLLVSDKKVSDISGEVGYVDHRYFSILFKKAYGATPSDYRKKYASSFLKGEG